MAPNHPVGDLRVPVQNRIECGPQLLWRLPVPLLARYPQLPTDEPPPGIPRDRNVQLPSIRRNPRFHPPAIRKKYDKKLVMRGGIDKHVLRGTEEDIRKELEYKMQSLMQEGGIAFGLDHRIPNGTPLENYRYYGDFGRELLGIPPRTGKSKGWQRMAF